MGRRQTAGWPHLQKHFGHEHQLQSFQDAESVCILGYRRREGSEYRHDSELCHQLVFFPDGAIQFNFTYNENLRSEINEKERILTPSVRWNITKRSYLDVSYQITRTRSDLEKTDSNFFSTNLKIFF